MEALQLILNLPLLLGRQLVKLPEALLNAFALVGR